MQFANLNRARSENPEASAPPYFRLSFALMTFTLPRHRIKTIDRIEVDANPESHGRFVAKEDRKAVVDKRTTERQSNGKRRLSGLRTDAAKRRETREDCSEVIARSFSNCVDPTSRPAEILPRHARRNFPVVKDCQTGLDHSNSITSHRPEDKIGETKDVRRMGGNVVDNEFVHAFRESFAGPP